MSFITLSEAQEMISTYQQNRSAVLAEGYSTDILPLNITLSKSEIMELLDQDGADGYRVYFGMEDGQDLLINVILVAVDENGDDILPQEEYLIINRGARCPYVCPNSSALNP